MPVLLKPYAIVPGRRETNSRFYLADCLEMFRELPRRSVDVIVTSPPYNLGHPLQPLPGHAVACRVPASGPTRGSRPPPGCSRPEGSLFLNVGARPSDPWTALDVAQAARAHLRLQNIIHWIKSIAIDRDSAGAAAGLDARPGGRPLQADQQRAVPERLPRVRVSLHPGGRDAARPARARRALPGPVEHRALAGRRRRRPLPGQHVVHSVRDDSAARPRPARIPRRSRRGCPSSASACTACPASELAMDPFTGLGSTAVACARLGVDFIGADIDETYLEEAVERVRERGRDACPRRGTARMKKAEPQRRRRRRLRSSFAGGHGSRGGGLSTYSCGTRRQVVPLASPSPRPAGGASCWSGLLE